ncbi:MAG: ankyrin repeat domain-containing protein [Gammaproteobacteria bacterium]|nr:ankyrin repeat domain-containing protein [Gammaproteobacteria bacterium]
MAQSSVGGKPLFDAAKSGDVELVRRHLDRGASPNERDWAEAPLILRAACYGQINVIRLLVERGADVNARQGDAWTAIFCAARYDELATVEFLIESGADLTLKDNDGSSIADTAREGEAWRVVRFLEGDAAQIGNPEPAELSCDELNRYIEGKTTAAFAASMERGSSAETKASESRRIFTEVGAIGMRGLIKNCASDEFGTAAVITYDSLSARSCKHLRLKHAQAVLAGAEAQAAFKRTVDRSDSDEEQGAAFGRLSITAKALGAIEEVLSERRCRAASSAEIELLMEAWLKSDNFDNFDLEREWDAIDQGDVASPQGAESATPPQKQRQAPAGCPRMGFHVEDGHLLKETGLKPKIADLVRVRLRGSGLYEPMAASSRRTSRHLAIRVSLPSSETDSAASIFLFSTEITFYQQSAEAGGLPVEAAWISGDSGAGSTSAIANDVLKHVDRFINEYKVANPICSGP